MKPLGFGIVPEAPAGAHGCPGGVFGGHGSAPPGPGGVHPCGGVAGGAGQISAEAGINGAAHMLASSAVTMRTLRSFIWQ